MLSTRLRWPRIVVLAAIGLALGCNLMRMPDGATPAPPSPSATPDSGWRQIVPGAERREMKIPTSGSDATAVVVRLDPALLTFRVHYSPGEPLNMDQWYDVLPQPVIVVNAAFFDENDYALGLLVRDGAVFGQSFSGFGGMFQVSAAGVRVRSLVSEPYQGEALVDAVQSFPMLVETGGVLARQGDGFDQRSRRTVVAQDRAGRIIFAVIPDGWASFLELQDWLLASDLDVNTALALDGGRSTAMGIYGPRDREVYTPLDELPSVIAVYTP